MCARAVCLYGDARRGVRRGCTLLLSVLCVVFPPPPPLKRIYIHGTVVLGRKAGEDLKGLGFVTPVNKGDFEKGIEIGFL